MSIENTHEELHAKLGASNAERWRNCRRSTLLIDELRRAGTIPLRTTNKYAAEGTAAHTYAEQLLRCELSGNDGADINAVFPIGHTTVVDDFEIKITEEMLEAVLMYVHYISTVPTGARVRLEQRVHIPEDGIIDRNNRHLTGDLWGTTDALIIAPFRYLEIVDYKHGAGKLVQAKDNDQLKFYLAAAYFSLPDWLRSEIRVLRGTIVQPRHRDGGIFSVEYTPEQIADERINLLLDAAKVTEDAELTAGPWCEWCPASLHCPARQQHHTGVLGGNMAKADAFEAGRILPVHELKAPQLLAIVQNADLVREYLDQAEELVKSQLLAGTAPDEIAQQYTLKTNYSNYAWVNEAQCGEVLKAELGDDAFTKPKLKSYSQIKAALDAKSKKTGVEFVGLDKMASRQVSSYSLKLLAEVPVEKRVASVKKMLETAI